MGIFGGAEIGAHLIIVFKAFYFSPYDQISFEDQSASNNVIREALIVNSLMGLTNQVIIIYSYFVLYFGYTSEE